MSMAEIITGVLFANGLTLGFLYACWRMNRQLDLWGPGIALFCLFFAGAAAIGADQSQERPEAPYLSAVQDADRK